MGSNLMSYQRETGKSKTQATLHFGWVAISCVAMALLIGSNGCEKSEQPTVDDSSTTTAASESTDAADHPASNDESVSKTEDTTAQQPARAPQPASHPTSPKDKASGPSITDEEQKELEAACEAANLPKPPPIGMLSGDMAAHVQEAINRAVKQQSAESVGNLANVYRVIAGSRDLSDLAVDCYKKAQSLDPKAFEWPYLLGQLYLARQSIEPARLAFKEAAELNPEYGITYARLGAIELQQKRANEAKEFFQKFLDVDPDDCHGLTGLASAEIMLGNLDAALPLLEKALSLKPNYGRAHLAIADYYEQKGMEELATATRYRARNLPVDTGVLVRDPVLLHLWCSLGNTLAMQKRILALQANGHDPESAILLAETMLQKYPDSPRLLTALAHVLHKTGQAEKALATIQKALEIAPDDEQSLLVMTDIHFIAKNTDDALATVNQAIQAHPESAEALLTKGRILASQNNLTEAAEILREAVSLQPSSERLLLALANILSADGKYKEAKDVCRQALNAVSIPGEMGNQRRAGIYSIVADICLAEGSIDQAIENLDWQLRATPGNLTAFERKIEIMIRAGRGRDALAECRTAVELSPESVPHRLVFGTALSQLGDDSSAIAQFTRAIELSPANVQGHYKLAAVFGRSGKNAEAEAELERTIELAPAFTDAYILLAQVEAVQKQYSKTTDVLNRGLTIIPDSPLLLNSLAWTLATCPDASVRQPTRAVELAEKAAELTNRQVHSILDTLAATYASAGRFNDAVATQKAAIQLNAEEPMAQPEYQKRLSLYESGKPFIDQ